MRWLAVPIVMALASQVHADEPARRWYPRVSGGVGIGAWIGELGALSPTGGTFELHADVEITPMLHVRAMLEHAFLTAHDDTLTMPVHVGLDGASLAIHHPIFGFDPKEMRVGGDMHVLAGIELERIRWDGVAPLRRAEVLVGFGGAIVIYDRGKRRPEQQIDYGIRMLFAHAPDAGTQPAGCDGPCNLATTSSPFDKTVIMEVSWQYGR